MLPERHTGPLVDHKRKLRSEASPSWWERTWEMLARAGLAETTQRLGTHALLIAIILFVAWGLRQLYMVAQMSDPTPASQNLLTNAAPKISAPADSPSSLEKIEALPVALDGIPRLARLHTDVPSRPRTEVTQYVVEAGDTLFGIADKFGLKPETLLWSNQAVLGDNPHNLRPGQLLYILPVDGVYHRWSAGDGLTSVAKFFGVQPEAIIRFAGNGLSTETIGDLSNPNITPGAWLIIPGGRREFVNWSAPDIPRDNPGVAKILGDGACETAANGAVGSGTFIWPANNHFLSGFDYDPAMNHPAIDLDGNEGDPIYAADSGVVVYAGWNDWGYGYMIVINHGNGWQTLYAHVSAYYVKCGQSVFQGNTLGAIGATGNATGPHLHFEMMLNGTKVDPHDYLR